MLEADRAKPSHKGSRGSEGASERTSRRCPLTTKRWSSRRPREPLVSLPITRGYASWLMSETPLRSTCLSRTNLRSSYLLGASWRARPKARSSLSRRCRM